MNPGIYTYCVIAHSFIFTTVIYQCQLSNRITFPVSNKIQAIID
jgi:hypothetical protein